MKSKLAPLFLVAFFVLSFVSGDAGAWPFHSSTLGQSSCDSLCQLFGILAQGQWKQLVAPSGISGVSNFSAHALGYECGNPSTNGACWCNDFDGNPTVGGAVCSTGSVETTGVGWADLWYGGYPNDHPLGNSLGYSAAGIRKSDGLVMLRGGGHAVVSYGGIGSVEDFNVEAAAANVVAGGQGGNWALLVPGGRLIANANGEPAWSQQNDTACASKSPWVTTNVGGAEMVQSPHTYWGTQPIPGTNDWFLGGSYDGCGTSGVQSSHNGALEVDASTGNTTLYGSFAAGSKMFPGGAYDPIDGKIYQGSYLSNDAQTIHAFTVTSPSAYADNPITTGAPCAGSQAYGRAIVFPDPAATTTDSDFFEAAFYGYTGTPPAPNAWVLVKHLHGVGGTRSYNCNTNISVLPGYTSGQMHGGQVAYDDDDGSFIWFNNRTGDLYRMVINFTTFSSTTFTKITTTMSGDIPDCPDSTGGNFATIEYIPASRPNSGGRAGVIASCNGLVFVRSVPF